MDEEMEQPGLNNIQTPARCATRLKGFQDSLRIINATGGGSTASQLQCGPETGVIRQSGVRREVRSRRALREDLPAFLGRKAPLPFAHQINGSLIVIQIN